MADEKRGAWKALYERAKGQINRVRDDNRESIKDLSLMAGNFIGAAGIGFMHGRQGAMPTLIGVPIDVLAWGIGGGLAFAARRSLGEYGTSMALGFGLAGQTYYVASVFAGIGQKMRKDKGELLGRQYTADELAKGGFAARPVITAGPMYAGAPGPFVQHEPANKGADRRAWF